MGCHHQLPCGSSTVSTSPWLSVGFGDSRGRPWRSCTPTGCRRRCRMLTAGSGRARAGLGSGWISTGAAVEEHKGAPAELLHNLSHSPHRRGRPCRQAVYRGELRQQDCVSVGGAVYRVRYLRQEVPFRGHHDHQPAQEPREGDEPPLRAQLVQTASHASAAARPGTLPLLPPPSTALTDQPTLQTMLITCVTPHVPPANDPCRRRCWVWWAPTGSASPRR
jgi:hypothetical protein